MISLSLFALQPLNKETHLVAALISLITGLGYYFGMPDSALDDSLLASIVTGTNWYVFKVFDSVTYDGADTSYGTLLGLFLCAVFTTAIYF